MAELSNSFSEGPAEERHVEHAKAIGRLALRVKRLTCLQAAGPSTTACLTEALVSHGARVTSTFRTDNATAAPRVCRGGLELLKRDRTYALSKSAPRARGGPSETAILARARGASS
jgi:hypothetical protein